MATLQQITPAPLMAMVSFQHHVEKQITRDNLGGTIPPCLLDSEGGGDLAKRDGSKGEITPLL